MFALYLVRTRRASFPGFFVASRRRFGSARQPLDPTTAAVGTLRARACAHRSGMVAFPDPDGRRGPSQESRSEARVRPERPRSLAGGPESTLGVLPGHPGGFIPLKSTQILKIVRFPM